MEQNFWRKCVVCKSEINFSTKYYKCSVRSCDKKRAPTQFCSVDCWDVHRSVMGHKSAGAEEFHSPTKIEYEKQNEAGPKIRVVKPQKKHLVENNEVLVVASKLKAYIKNKAELNTSAEVLETLSNFIREHCDQAIESAKQDGRKTVMAKDFKKI
jgi:histone H3/H4